MPDLGTLLLALIAIVALLALRSVIQRVTVYEYQGGLKYRDGRFVGLVGPGRHWIYRP